MDVHRYVTIAGLILLLLTAGETTVAANEGIAPKTIKASRIIDGDVYDAEGALIGEVDDLIIRRGGRVKKLTMEFGGFLDIGDKLVALSFKSFSIDDGRISLSLTEDQLKHKKEFNYFLQGLQPAYYYRPRPPHAGPFRLPQQSMYDGHEATNAELGPYAWASSPSKFLASTVMHRRLINPSGELLGMVVDLIIDPATVMVSHIVIASDALPNEPERLYLPYDPLDFTAYGIVYGITSTELTELVGAQGDR